MTRDESVAVAKAFADARGWTWLEPIEAQLRRAWGIGAPRWHVRSNSAAKGCNVWVEIDDRSEQVVKANFVPR